LLGHLNNGVVERKNMTVHEMARTMLMDSKLTDVFWTHAVHTTVHIQNRVMLRNNSDKNPYELWKGRPTNVKHFKVFGSKCYIKREDEEWESLILMWTKAYLLVTQVQGKHTMLQSKAQQSCGKHQCND
jgi:hypothetical protein